MKKIYVILGAVAVAASAGVWWSRRSGATGAATYRMGVIQRGDLQSTVAATGTLNAVTTVQVGTQVSGQVSAIYVDFNDKAKKGQLLARIDPTLAEQAVADAQAGLERVQAQYLLAEQEYNREKQLSDSQMVTQSEFQTAVANHAVAKAAVTSAQISLDRARKNLSYTSIFAPIDGVIVERDVDVGQTVAASLSAPQLFLIANDLARMQILAAVDESDIGAIKEGLRATFTVPSFTTRVFSGLVRQVRLQSKTTDNVVSYTTVIAVENRDGALLPGMTATVSFITGSAVNVLTAPNAALRFRPVGVTLASTTPGAATVRGSSRGDSARTARLPVGGAVPPGPGSVAAAPPRADATLWRVGADGKLQGVRVATGISDGQRTVILGSDLAVGDSVVVGATIAGGATTGGTTNATNPLQPRRTQGAGRPPGAP
jgi:HlyD family secretion protein